MQALLERRVNYYRGWNNDCKEPLLFTSDGHVQTVHAVNRGMWQTVRGATAPLDLPCPVESATGMLSDTRQRGHKSAQTLRKTSATPQMTKSSTTQEKCNAPFHHESATRLDVHSVDTMLADADDVLSKWSNEIAPWMTSTQKCRKVGEALLVDTTVDASREPDELGSVISSFRLAREEAAMALATAHTAREGARPKPRRAECSEEVLDEEEMDFEDAAVSSVYIIYLKEYSTNALTTVT